MAPVIIVHGPTGAGKSNQAKKLAERESWAYISTGDLLRATGDRELLARLESGDTAPSATVERLVTEAFGFIPADQPLVLDGFPRLYPELEWLDRYLPTVKREVTKVIEISVPPEVSRTRVAYRHRDGDDDAAVERKLAWYRDEVEPILAEFDRRGVLARVDGSDDDEAVYRRVQEAL